MTLEEKVAALCSVDCRDLVSAERLDAEKLAARLALGCASITGIAAVAEGKQDVFRDTVDQLRAFLCDQTRLGIAAFICESPESLSGLLHPELNILPIAMAASFDPIGVAASADRLRESCLNLGVNQLLAPSLALDPERRMRDAGRSFGGDAYLAGRMGVAFLRGMRGDDGADSVLACAGRFLAEAAADADWQRASVGRRELRERFAEPFSVVIREGGLAALLVADMTIDGVPCTGAAEVLNNLLREDLGYKGFVISSAGGIANLEGRHRVAADRRDAAVQALSAGVDMELGGNCFAAELVAAVSEGQLGEELIDRAVRRVLISKFQLGLLDAPSEDDDQAHELSVEQPLLGRVSFESAATSLHETAVVLLKNDGPLLPLAADAPLLLLGDSGAALLDALRAQGRDVVHVPVPHRGMDPESQDRLVIVCFDDADQTQEAEPVFTEIIEQLASRQLVAATVLAGDCIHLAGELADICPAVIINWQQSVGSARAVAGVLTGVVNPSGRLPLTLQTRTAAGPVEFPFGLGLSYSHFEYRQLLCPETVDTHGAVEVSVEVINESERSGAEVVQLYCHDPVADTARPSRQLVGFHRLSLAPGQAKRISFRLDVSQFAYYNRALEYVVEAGLIELLARTLESRYQSPRPAQRSG